MAFWLARPTDQLRKTFIKRFDPRFFTVNFPRPVMASVVTTAHDAVRVTAVFYNLHEIVGVIWDSVDHHSHPLLSYETSRDYHDVKLSFRWHSSGCTPLDRPHGPTLTIEGRDMAGVARVWYVRLWNYASGTPTDAVITIDFADLLSGYRLPDDAQPVWPADIDRMFITLTPDGYSTEGGSIPHPMEAQVTVTDISCAGAGSTLELGDVDVPAHDVRLATAFDDSYHVTPERVLHNLDRLGYRDMLNHYVGMSHYYRLSKVAGVSGLKVDAAASLPLNAACAAWHADFFQRAHALGYEVIVSLSYELFDEVAPDGWKQRDANGRPALTGWVPPSTLLSPCVPNATDYLARVALAFTELSAACGLRCNFQIGEPWWWIDNAGRPYIHDAASELAYVAETGAVVPPRIADVGAALTAAQRRYCDWLGTKLGESVLRLRDSVRARDAAATTYLLLYTPQLLGSGALTRVALNVPLSFKLPAFDVLQVEDYDYLLEDAASAHEAALRLLDQRLGYPHSRQHYFSGFALTPDDGQTWSLIEAALERSRRRSPENIVLWAFPQVVRDGFVYFAADEIKMSFIDELFPITIGTDAIVTPSFSTQVLQSANGFERRFPRHEDAVLLFDAGPGVRSDKELGTLIRFYRRCRGPAVAFRFRDPLDHSSNDMTAAATPTDQVLGVGDGTASRFPLIKDYTPGPCVRRITRPVVATVRVAINGTELPSGWAVADRGIVEFDVPPAAGSVVTAGYHFDVPTRFATDQLEVALRSIKGGTVPSVLLREVREA